jgi:hypothetical protein
MIGSSAQFFTAQRKFACESLTVRDESSQKFFTKLLRALSAPWSSTRPAPALAGAGCVLVPMSYETVRWTLFPLTFCAVTYGQRGQSHPTLRGAAAVGLRRPLHAADGLAQCAGALCLFFGRAVQHNGPRLSLTFRTVTFFSESTLSPRALARAAAPLDRRNAGAARPLSTTARNAGALYLSHLPRATLARRPPSFAATLARRASFPMTARDAGALLPPPSTARDAGAAATSIAATQARRAFSQPSPATLALPPAHPFSPLSDAWLTPSAHGALAGMTPAPYALRACPEWRWYARIDPCVVDPERTWRVRGQDACAVRAQGLS